MQTPAHPMLRRCEVQVQMQTSLSNPGIHKGDPLYELEQHNATRNVADQVKRTLKRSLAGRRPVLQDVAQELGTSTRTLQRKLGDMNVTFKHLVEETRREMAQDYLRQSTIDLSGVAFLLGYEDSNSFFRAFQEWEGTTPGEWRTRNPAPLAHAVGR
ncbi:helix-turn-helix transcriptional regulator [Verrucomicrobium sp. BvORR106]|uniref:helix-turn-helix transcriptional regulator n=1 Tax=Verrucomicrobium sp. BvORR106 TaxID=1403819 RepID=UPI00068C0F46|nr:helix-turn-helix transcriptional regulator [Verrucomicrobium sp. BvORR106]